MPQVYFKFFLFLDDYPIPRGDVQRGLAFHRWLPQGRTDAVSLATEDAAATLMVWIERRGTTESGWYVCDLKQRNVDDAIVARQGLLPQVLLEGELSIADVTPAQAAALTSCDYSTAPHDATVSPELLALGKRVVRLLHPSLARFVDTLRTTFG